MTASFILESLTELGIYGFLAVLCIVFAAARSSN